MFAKIRLLPALVIFATILFGVRVGNIWLGVEQALDIGAAHAESAPAENAPAESEEDVHPESDKAAAEDDTGDEDSLDFSRAELELLQNLAHRRAELDAHAKSLDMREKVIEVTERRVDEKLGEIKHIEASIKAEMAQYDTAQLSKLARLVKVYESMKPKDAARIFDSLAMDVLMPVAERMNERKIAVILGKMSPDNAKTLTEELGARKELSLPRR